MSGTDGDSHVFALCCHIHAFILYTANSHHSRSPRLQICPLAKCTCNPKPAPVDSCGDSLTWAGGPGGAAKSVDTGPSEDLGRTEPCTRVIMVLTSGCSEGAQEFTEKKAQDGAGLR